MYNPTANSNMMSHSNQIYNQCAINNSQDQQLELQQQHIQQQQQQQPQQITISQTQHSYSCHSEHDRTINAILYNRLLNIGPIVITPTTEIVNLLSPPSSPIPSIVYKQMEKISEVKKKNSRNNGAFKVNNV